jgi:hypothetical protein
MVIREYFYNEEKETLLIEFSTKEDGDDFYRSLNLDLNLVKFYSPIIITEYELNEIDDDFISELILEYLKENDLPEQMGW